MQLGVLVIFAFKKKILLIIAALVLLAVCGAYSLNYYLFEHDPLNSWFRETYPAKSSVKLKGIPRAPKLCRRGQPAEIVSDVTKERPELSGLEISATVPDTAYQINDSGHEPFLYISDLKGQVKAKVRYAKDVVDPEDISLGPCLTNSASSCIYVGDIGDNFRRRRVKQIYFQEESRLDNEKSFQKLSFYYPNKKRVDSETLMVHPVTGDIYLVTKGPRSYVFKLAAATVNNLNETHEAQFVMRLSWFWWAAGGDITHDGRSFVLISDNIYHFRLDLNAVTNVVGRLSGGLRVRIPSQRFRQQEAIAFQTPINHKQGGVLYYGTEERGSDPAQVAKLSCAP